MKRIVALLALSCLAFAATAAPYSPWQFGITGGVSPYSLIGTTSYSEPYTSVGSLGFQLHILPFLSVKPSLFIYGYEQDATNKYSSFSQYSPYDRTIMGGSISVPLHLLSFSNGSIYVGPSLTYYKYASTEQSQTGTGSTYKSYEDEYSIFAFGGIVGGQYQFSRQFGVFMELGFGYSSCARETTSYISTGAVSGNSEYTYRYYYCHPPVLGLVFYL